MAPRKVAEVSGGEEGGVEIAANERSENEIIVNYYSLILFSGSEVGYMILGGRGNLELWLIDVPLFFLCHRPRNLVDSSDFRAGEGSRRGVARRRCGSRERWVGF